ncbi:RNA-guided pseudouridylation complex pseudouridine synthase subunit Cbf5 [Picrophilus oshimae]|uniref:Probable tRNA pseudouridine synthase B n=1 Tax=Picrophilus torridus (strain ATCC 700027 / DSM 9790 / JCM 10055 / NBRC 100828 / KAW 2/3) TaxID=1122961 RepID=A0A8G2FVW3_PICTO|nr:RNA-guided pseudouridylation complex pseudouridine synthase subunit Cbf5 [Picrophilus oshimae]SMD30442.1 tRNA pseudouridine synthase B [Picrophilus oshimae DSM 9789]
MSNLNGFIVVDKPKGPTSHQIDSWIRDITGEPRVGHIGTLDPGVSGVLVMALGKATKLIDIVHRESKEYVSVLRTYDKYDYDSIKSVFKEFTGKIYQIPPVRSAVSRELRIREIYNLELLEMDEKLVLFKVCCESGTYIRTLCTDIGYVLGSGGQMAELRRTRTGPFDESMCHTLQEVSDAFKLKSMGNEKLFKNIFIPMDFIFIKYPKVIVKETALKNIAHGSDIYPAGIHAITGSPKKGDVVAVYTEKNELIATGTMMVNADEIYDLKVIDIDNVLIETGDNDGKDSLVRKDNRWKDIPVQKPERKLHGNLQGSQEWKDTGNRGNPKRGGTGSKGFSSGFRKRKAKR